jgi:hypothetical protein
MCNEVISILSYNFASLAMHTSKTISNRKPTSTQEMQIITMPCLLSTFYDILRPSLDVTITVGGIQGLHIQVW